ncbi:uncharacterized protein LOC132047847 [Lycium ferocissimum]|uniref:uncharacterized protein LOC132047847 n=1 Tax=Lycium ferocissimum TaxID=112874 RepID=UPI0028163980|nr:uncharacterized protein LOC132047847 [Lycium ferocissimum]
MAIELCSDDSSPRISFSHDISQTDTAGIPSTNSSSSNSGLDFDFCVFHQSLDLESSSADELFFDGKILPIEMKRKIPPTLPPNKPLTKSHKLVIPHETSFKNEKLIKMKSGILDSNEKQSSKSFWRFKRSNSSSSSTSYARTLCPLALLSRSNSTGSTPSVKHKQNSQRSSSSLSNGHHQKPPLRKIPSNPYSSGIKINSVLNVPPANLFGLSSIFSSGKEKNKKR